jgi:phosphoserine phosphatase RsbU/P
MTAANLLIPNVILDSLSDGLYVCNTDRKIVYWSKSAERLTGWLSEDVVGHRCMDNILNHIDTDGRPLCGEELCPLRRCMVTGRSSASPAIIFGKTKSGERLPMAVTVAPLHDENGLVIGGVETFRDYSETYANLERAKQIQTLSLEHDLPKDNRVSFATFYLPHDMIGGDYFAIRQLDDDNYGFILADVMGHGVAAALHTMELSSLWNRHCHALTDPAHFARLMNRDLCRIVRDESFATALCGILNASNNTVRIASAGGPTLVIARKGGGTEQLSAPGLPFGLIADADYDEREFSCAPGDAVLMFTDGAVEVCDPSGGNLGTEGLVCILGSLGYPDSGIRIEALQEALLTFSNAIRLDDDLTLLEIRFPDALRRSP